LAVPFDFESELPAMWEIRFVAVPEPDGALLLATSLVALAWSARRAVAVSHRGSVVP
jgi:hypothetical protein